MAALKRAGFVCVTAVIALLFSFSAGLSARQPEANVSLEYKNGLLTVKAKQVPVARLLEAISEKTGVQIFLLNQKGPSEVSVEVVERPFEEALRMILRGTSYAIIYNRPGSVFAMGDLTRWASAGKSREGEETAAVNPHETALWTGDAQKKATETFLLERIAEVTKRIEDGSADEEYKHWAAIKGELYVEHDRDRLKHYEEQLAKL